MTIIYLECGTTIRSSFNTGIQRVVRNIINNKKSIEDLSFVDECHLVEYVDQDFYILPKTTIAPDVVKADAVLRFLQSTNIFFKKKCNPHLHKIFKYILHGTYAELVNARIRWGHVKAAKKGRSELLKLNKHKTPSEAKKILILLDSSWHDDMWPRVSDFQKSGGFVYAVLYDLIPFSHPETVEITTRKLHTNWWRSAIKKLDGVVCISKAVQNELNEWQLKITHNKLPVDYFYLGSELNESDPVIKVLNTPSPFFLMVGSIEPRKNHSIVLDAFESLWLRGISGSLVICANNSWMSEELMERIKAHPQLNQQLFLVEKASDRDLVYLNKSCCALIMASIAEGFGLPIVEALQLGAKVICNDIPVFREIGEQNVTYFSFNNSHSLELLIEDHINQYLPTRELEKKWISWPESARMLGEKCLGLSIKNEVR
ncbi:glycosyltransferase family 4 protein [Polynucleobacter sp. JS-Safj-400b-B2]|uniref:glycosyltransferase family 4 protein n=1 Tax=Polynucleobacter sp. JS-Safj-400b-B2 TaxID=2576921 RepID=UPI001C0C7898|nr:glycosyltransferase family 1 protein [Polynucleobacter sp. JS-Safj-400b-B2]MBU3625048.1 glycosyltransferase family 4 protein [Polynucleobacter sp. JS-Safj-400b-B2]